MKRWNHTIGVWLVFSAAGLGFSQDGGADEARVVYILGSVTAAPGETVRVPFSIWSNRETRWLLCSVRFDETVLEPTGVEPVWERPAGKPWDVLAVCAKPFPCGSMRDPGWALYLAITGSGLPGWPLAPVPSGVETRFMDLLFRVLPGAKAEKTVLRFEDYREYRNQVGLGTDKYETSFPDVGEGTAASVLIPGTVTITAERALRRGDANDDGALDISDPVTALGYLFLGGAPPPAQSSDCGHDPTEDDLSCTQYAACP